MSLYPISNTLKDRITTEWKLDHYVIDHYLDSYYLLYWKKSYYTQELYSTKEDDHTNSFIVHNSITYKVIYLDSIKELDNSDQIMLSFRNPKVSTQLIPVVLVKRAIT